MKIAEIKKQAQRAISHLQQASDSIERIRDLIKLRGGVEQKLSVGVTGDFELVILYNGHELPIKEAVEILEIQGYLTPDDFL